MQGHEVQSDKFFFRDARDGCWAQQQPPPPRRPTGGVAAASRLALADLSTGFCPQLSTDSCGSLQTYTKRIHKSVNISAST
jgi:hypothetical protein